MIRTVWLGLVLLIGLFGLACFKLAIGSPRPIAILQATAVAAVREMPEIRTSPVPDTLTKGDRLPVTYISTVEPLATKLQVPPSVAAPKTISRHWHDPSDPRAPQGGTKKSKSKDLTKNARRVERKPSAPEACNPDRSSPLRRLLGPAKICSKMRMVTTP